MAARLKSILACVLALRLVSALGAGEPRDISFVAAHDRSEQRYVLVLPEAYDSAQPHDLLICLHGHGSDRWQFVREERGEARAARAIAAQHSMILVSPDYRATTSWMGPAAEADLVQIIGELKKQHAIRRVVLSGGSMGATSALTFTALHPDLVDGVVALNGHANHLEYTNFQEAIQIAFGGTKEAIPEEYRKRSAEFFPERFTMPIAITAGGKDTTVPPDSVMRLGRAIQKHNPAVYLDFQETRGHETDYDAALSAYDVRDAGAGLEAGPRFRCDQRKDHPTRAGFGRGCLVLCGRREGSASAPHGPRRRAGILADDCGSERGR